MTKIKLKVSDINEISRQIKTLEDNSVAFADFEFNLSIANLFAQCRPITETYEKALLGSIAEARKNNMSVPQEDINKMNDKLHEIDMPDITAENLKKTGQPLPTIVLSVLGKYIKAKDK